MRPLLIFIVVGCLLFVACGKPKPKIPRANTSITAALHYDFKLPLAIPAGEKLVYELKVTRFPIYASAGEITFEYLGTKTQPNIERLDFKPAPDEQFLHFRAAAISRGLLIKLFNLSVNDRFETFVAPHKFRTQAIVKEIEEVKKHRLQTGIYRYDKHEAVYRTTDVNNPQSPAKEITLKLEDGAMDLLAAFYFVRMQNLPDGVTLKFPLIFDAERVEFDLLVHGREEISTDLGKFKTIKVEPKLFGPGRLIAKEGEMFMWFTDDVARVPIKVTAKTSGATLNAELIRK